MNAYLKKFSWWLFATLCTLVGLYPITYFVIDRHFGLLSSKSQELLNNLAWNIGFYGHIIFGGISLLIGWIQFSTHIRNTRITWHKNVGKTYLIAVLISGICSIYIGFFATGGFISMSGFILLGIIWVLSTILAYKAVLDKKIQTHQNLMILSYAACFSAVTLRLWLPILTSLTGEFLTAYKIVAWLCWVPNILFAYWLINRRKESLI